MQKDKTKPFDYSNLKQAVHDLNNIFTSSINSIDILENVVNKDVGTQKLISTIRTNSLRAVDIINNLLSHKTKQKNEISIYDLVTDIKLTTKATLPKNVKLQFRFGKNLNKINANYTDLYRVLLNLIVNASEAIIDKGTIIFSAKNSRRKDSVLISIKDNGIGISTKKLKDIFNDGYSTKSRSTNSGIGLTIVQQIIEEYNGKIEVTSQYRSGTKFAITIPTVNTTETNNNRNKQQTILLADDDLVILELFSELLASYNYKVITSKDGKDAANKFKKDTFDLVIVDKTMPKINGFELIKLIRKSDSTIPIILTTGSQEAIDEEYPKLNKKKKIKKPWSFEDMLDCIRILLT